MCSDNKMRLDTQQDIQYLPGVGPKRITFFQKLGITTVADLLDYYPRSHLFIPPITLIEDLLSNQSVSIVAEVKTVQFKRYPHPAKMNMVIEDKTGDLKLTFFHASYMQDKILPGDLIVVWGKTNLYRKQVQLTNPRWKIIENIEEVYDIEDAGEPIYSATSELSSGQIGRVIRESLDDMLKTIEQWYTESHNKRAKLLTRRLAYQWIHRPENKDQVSQATRRLKYDELFLMMLGIGLRREQLKQTQPAYQLPCEEDVDIRIRKRFPFQLTDEQNKVISEICKDMDSTIPMNRLLQGDVGSGKTVVAVYAALLAITHKKQIAIMAPTEILAEQHYNSIESFLEGSQVNRYLLTGGMVGKKRSQILFEIENGHIDIVVGTQALLQQDIKFKDLALVIVDEQHKFGVKQRQVIRGKDIAPHYLVMTATPIPRTMGMTLFGDLDISTIDALPPGRSPVDTRWISPDKFQDAYRFVRQKVAAKEQVFFVYPRLEETPELNEPILDVEATTISPDDPRYAYATGELKSAISEHLYLQETVFPNLSVGLLHGQMDKEEKQQVMQKFKKGDIDILVATVVIEVGIDVPNASVMIIEHAERFGLAQLHQLRGRIGRGDKKSFCFLFAQPLSEEGVMRMEIMCDTQDGFRIAEEDLRIRGPGQIFGTAQSGLPDLKIAHIIEDIDLLRMAKKEAFALAKEDMRLIKPENAALKKALLKRFGNTLNLVDVA